MSFSTGFDAYLNVLEDAALAMLLDKAETELRVVARRTRGRIFSQFGEALKHVMREGLFKRTPRPVPSTATFSFAKWVTNNVSPITTPPYK